MKNEEGILVKNRELKRLKVIEQVIEKKIKQRQAGKIAEADGKTSSEVDCLRQERRYKRFNPQAAREDIQPAV